MNLGKRFGSFVVKFGNDFVKNIFARIIAIDFDEEAEIVVVLNDWHGLLAEFPEAVFEDIEIFIVEAVATIIQSFGGFKTPFDIGFGDIEENDGFDFVATAGGDRHNLIFFA